MYASLIRALVAIHAIRAMEMSAVVAVVCLPTMANGRQVAARQREVAHRAADDFEAAGDPGMAQMLRAHAAHLAHAEATLPAPGSEATPP